MSILVTKISNKKRNIFLDKSYHVMTNFPDFPGNRKYFSRESREIILPGIPGIPGNHFPGKGPR